MGQFIERCGVPNPADGRFCQLPKGHQGPHNASEPTASPSSPAPTSTPIYQPGPMVVARPPTNPWLIGCLIAIGIVVGLPILIGIIVAAVSGLGNSASRTLENEASQLNSGSQTSHRSSSTVAAGNPCDLADQRENQASTYWGDREYQKTYDAVISGLHYVELCGNDDDDLLNKAYLMSFKGYAEHSLGSGDWRTDLNEANTLLVECQTHPGFYGTHTGAQCETQENNNITATTNWDVESQ